MVSPIPAPRWNSKAPLSVTLSSSSLVPSHTNWDTLSGSAFSCELHIQWTVSTLSAATAPSRFLLVASFRLQLYWCRVRHRKKLPFPFDYQARSYASKSNAIAAPAAKHKAVQSSSTHSSFQCANKYFDSPGHTLNILIVLDVKLRNHEQVLRWPHHYHSMIDRHRL